MALVDSLPEKATLNPQFVVLKNIKCLNKFLFYSMMDNNFQKQINKIISGTAVPTLSQKNLGETFVFLPSLSEQQRIVAKLDAVFTEIDREVQNTNEIINLSNTNLKKIIDDKTEGNDNWIEFKVKDLGIVKTGNTPKSSEKENYGSEIPFVKPPHFNSDGSITITDVGLSKKGSKLSRSAPANSVLMVCIGATIGKVGINNIDVCFNQQINSVTSSDKFDAELIYWQMRGKRFQNDVIQNAGQATLPIINKSKWQNLSIFLPESLNKQIEIRTLLRKINTETENFINNKLQKIQNLYALKTAILKKALLQSEAP